MSRNMNSYNPLNNPLLRDVERLSPKAQLCLCVGYDDEGWEAWEGFSALEIVTIGELSWRIQGFTLDDEVVVSPHGLNHHPAVRWMTVHPAAIRKQKDEYAILHRDGIVEFAEA